MTITRILLCVILLGSGAGGSFGEVNLNLGTGIRDEHEREDRLPALSLAADFGSANWPVRPEVLLAVLTRCLSRGCSPASEFLENSEIVCTALLLLQRTEARN